MCSHPFLAPAPIQLLWEQSKLTQMQTKHVQRSGLRKDRTLTAPAQTIMKGTPRCRCLFQPWAIHIPELYWIPLYSFPLSSRSPYPDLWNIKYSASFRMKLISWTPLSSLLISTNMNSLLQKTTATLPKVQLKPKPMLVVFPN